MIRPTYSQLFSLDCFSFKKLFQWQTQNTNYTIYVLPRWYL